ncbi:MAG: hypothetical protein K9L71_02120 [Candidatus Omnitrophica bacterium]|nr:hypothetical protein [Candidatus Omnitrophota bacterium]
MNSLCKRCVLPEHKPDIWLNKDGFCNICVDFDRQKAIQQSNKLLESDLIKVLNKYRDKGSHDCLIMCSGGKDSIMSLYYMKKKYKMNPLVFTFDHGFENEEAFENIKKAVDALKVDWLYYKTRFMKDVFAQIIKNDLKVSICHICAIWYMQLTYDIAARYKIPLIVAGWTKGQCNENGDSSKAYLSMSKATSDFVVNYMHNIPKYKGFPTSMSKALKRARRKFKTKVISPHWYLQWDKDEIMEILRKELGWKMPLCSYPKDSTNCMLNFASVDLSMKHYGYTHYHIEMSKLIRVGELSREEALDMLKIDFDKEMMKGIFDKIEH